MTLTIYTDGGSLNNPGQSAYAYVLYKESQIIDLCGEKIGIATNNIAEYTALIKALERVVQLKKDHKLDNLAKINVFADSSLMINQINGLFKVKNSLLRELIFKIRVLENEINIPIDYTHIPREKNQLADSLVKKALGR